MSYTTITDAKDIVIAIESIDDVAWEEMSIDARNDLILRYEILVDRLTEWYTERGFNPTGSDYDY